MSTTYERIIVSHSKNKIETILHNKNVRMKKSNDK